MPATTARTSTTKTATTPAKTTKKEETVAAPAAETKTTKAAAAPVAAPAPVEPVEAADPVDGESSDVSPLQAETLAAIEQTRSLMTILQNHLKTLRSVYANQKRLERDNKRLDKKSKRSRENRASNGNKGLQQLKPVYTAEMRTFFENNKTLSDNDGQLIVDNLTYDSDHLLVSRKQALKLVTSYIRFHKLQDETNKRKINMDSTLQALFPELCAVKDKKGKVVQEENCHYNTLMKALSRHFTQ